MIFYVLKVGANEGTIVVLWYYYEQQTVTCIVCILYNILLCQDDEDQLEPNIKIVVNIVFFSCVGTVHSY